MHPMKKLSMLTWLTAFLLLTFSSSFAPVEHGVYVQLHPDNNKKIVIQIVPDKTYSNVVAYINFYSANNKRVAQKAYSLSDDKDKYIRKNQCTNRVFKFSFDETVTRVKIDHVNEGEVLDKESTSSKGTPINLPISEKALGPIEK
jgi:hypothetical protein